MDYLDQNDLCVIQVTAKSIKKKPKKKSPQEPLNLTWEPNDNERTDRQVVRQVTRESLCSQTLDMESQELGGQSETGEHSE